MSLSQALRGDQQLARVLQVGVVLEELVEARAYEHYRALAAAGDEVEEDVEELLLEANEESREHRDRLASLVADLEAESIPHGEIEALVREKYGRSAPDSIESVLHDQRASEETAYNYYDGVIAAIEAGDADFSVDRERLLSTLREIRAEEAEGADEVDEVIEGR